MCRGQTEEKRQLARSMFAFRFLLDDAGRDVSRASFVSFDEGLWFRPHAQVLPVDLLPEPGGPDTVINHCVRRPALPWWLWLARDVLPYERKEDGTFKTHGPLLELSKRLVLRAERLGEGLADSQLHVIAEDWFFDMPKARTHVARQCWRSIGRS
jgi:hypothetical protein